VAAATLRVWLGPKGSNAYFCSRCFFYYSVALSSVAQGSSFELFVPTPCLQASRKAAEWVLTIIYKDGDELSLLHVIPQGTPGGQPLVFSIAAGGAPTVPLAEVADQHVSGGRCSTRGGPMVI
jgi:hypothetical protein